jgi:hypothetical protein
MRLLGLYDLDCLTPSTAWRRKERQVGSGFREEEAPVGRNHAVSLPTKNNNFQPIPPPLPTKGPFILHERSSNAGATI